MDKIWLALALCLMFLPLAARAAEGRAEQDLAGMKMEKTEKKAKTLIVLVHGYCKGAKDMQFWKEAMLTEGCDIITPDLPTTYDSFEDCVEKLTRDIEAAEPEKYENLYIAGHSMGGLMAREYLQRKKPPNARRLVCVGTPHYGSKLADIALWIPFMGMIHKPLYALKP
ncbi:MAG: alpha/beta fold hydrolase, partial [Lentisphaeria bacterium]|nr:alpha/beta fold hydrolase [Lentisphaeria bacterium]